MAKLSDQPVTADDLMPLALTSYGHFTSMRVDAEGRIRGLSLHLDRLSRDSREVFGTAVDPGRVRTLVAAALAEHSGPCIVRVTNYDPAVNLGRPADAREPELLVTVRPAGQLPPPPLTAMTIPYERDLPLVKHAGLFGALHARRAAQLAGFDDALFVGRDGLVSEGGTWNVGFIDTDGTVVWPQAPVLPGVTMALLQEQRADWKTTPVTVNEAKGMAAAFATNTSIGVRAVAAIDDQPMPVEHPLLTELRDAYLSVPGEEL
ncbi:aminotransferase class IV family protein [Streptomyces sp. NPDC127068]|uniref:aminotransferase class IV family protein n=1 Tax=Streptomyces sp. NPDC127068 TaxID=3347127 RepID=UPI003650E7C6